MKRTSISKLTVIILALVIMTSGLTGCKMNLPDTSKIGPGGTAESGKESDDDGESGEGGLTLEDVLASGDESEEETTASKYLIEENVAPPNDIENLDIIGGNGELIGFSFPDQQCEKWMLMEKQIDKVLHASGYNAEFR